MADDAPDVLAARLRAAFDLSALGESIRRAQLRRERPGATDAEIDALVVVWLQTRPGAEHGDAWGRAISWPPAGDSPPEAFGAPGQYDENGVDVSLIRANMRLSPTERARRADRARRAALRVQAIGRAARAKPKPA